MPSYITDQERLEQELEKNKKNSNPEKPIKTTKETRTTTYEKVGNTDTDTVRDEPEKEYTPSNAYWDFINNSLDQYKPKPNTPDAERQQRLAKVHAITEGLRTLGEAFALHKGAPVERRNPNKNVLRALQEYNRIRATDDAKAYAFNNMAMNLRLKAMAQDDENRYRTNRDKKEDERFNKKMEFEREEAIAKLKKEDKYIDPLDKKKKEKEIEKLQAEIEEINRRGKRGEEKEGFLTVVAEDKQEDNIPYVLVNNLINHAASLGNQEAINVKDTYAGRDYPYQDIKIQTLVQDLWLKYKYDILDKVDGYNYLRRKRITNDKPNPFGLNLFQTRPTLKGEGVLRPEYIQGTTQQEETNEDTEFSISSEYMVQGKEGVLNAKLIQEKIDEVKKRGVKNSNKIVAAIFGIDVNDTRAIKSATKILTSYGVKL